jgi:HK97 family phage major capsid protein
MEEIMADKKEKTPLTKEVLEESLKSVNDEVIKTVSGLTDKLDDIQVSASEREEDMKAKGDFENFSEFVKTVASNPNDKRIKALNTGVNSEGGALIPRAFSQRIWEKSIEGDEIYNRTMRMPTTSNNLTFPTVKDDDHSSNIYGGVKTYYTEEAAQITGSQPSFGRINFKLKKLAALVHVPNEMIEDSPVTLEPFLMTKFSDVLRWRRNKDILVGTGANQPLGILNAPCLITIAKEDSQVANTVNVNNLIKQYARFKGKDSGVWLINPTVIPQLLSLTMGSGNFLVYTPPNGLAGAPYGTLLGKPIIYTEHAKTLGSKGDVILADLSQYGILEKSNGINTVASMHLKFDYDMGTYRLTYRWDGQPMDASAFTPENGDSLSPFVTIAERA